MSCAGPGPFDWKSKSRGMEDSARKKGPGGWNGPSQVERPHHPLRICAEVREDSRTSFCCLGQEPRAAQIILMEIFESDEPGS
jgi:hypothetical protein